MSGESEESLQSLMQTSSAYEDSVSPAPSTAADSVVSGLPAPSVSYKRDGNERTLRDVSSPGEDAGKYKLECRHLRSRLKQLLAENQSEQDANSQLRKKLSVVERDRLESASKANEEMSTLQTQVAKLRSQLEKGEASRQDLEFELAKARRQISQEKRSATERETMITDVSENMKSKVNVLNQQIKELQGQLQEYKQTSADEENRLRRSLQEKEEIISNTQAELETLESEKEALHGDVQRKELVIADMTDQLTKLEEEKESMSDNIRRQGNEIGYGKEKEERLKQDLETAVQRIKTLEETIEAERAAHLESKFNSEIVQLRVRDLETVVENEKTAKLEEKSVSDNLTQQLRDLESAYAEERKMSKHTRDVLEKTEKEYANVQKQLSTEVESKKMMIKSLSEQLEIHQKNFDELKDELRKAKKRQAYLEDTYGGCMRELELLLQNYQLELSQSSVRRSRDRKERVKPPSPSAVIESLRQTLDSYQKKMNSLNEELTKYKQTSSNLSKEGETYRDKLKSKEKTLDGTQRSLEETSRELERVRNECTELEACVASLKVDMAGVTHALEKEKARNQETSDEIVRLAKKYKHDEEDKVHYLHQLYQRVLSMQRVTPGDYNKMSWADMSNLVLDQVNSLMSSLHTADERVKSLEEAVRKSEKATAAMHLEHGEQMERMSRLTQEQEADWLRQKQELEDHYTQVLSEVHGRSQKSQAMVDQAWEKVRVTGSIQQGLETECSQLRTALQQGKEEKSALVTSCALLMGTVYPLHSRLAEMASQRSVLLGLLESGERAKHNANALVETLTNEMDNDMNMRGGRRRPLLRFRVAAVCVMAANRLQYLGRMSCRMFTVNEGRFRDNGLMVCAGQPGLQRPPFRGVALVSGSFKGQGSFQRSDHGALTWLSGTDLVEIALSSTAELRDVMMQLRDRDTHTDVKLLYSSAKSALHKLIEKVDHYYPGVEPGLVHVAARDRTSLLHQLSYSLDRTLTHIPNEQRGRLLSFKQTMSCLQQRLLEFTKRLHSAEVERRDLRGELTRSKEEVDQLLQTASRLEQTEGELRNMKSERKNLIETTRFDSVCQELESALKREQQAQQLLNEQSTHMHSLSRKLDSQASEGLEKAQTLQEAVQGLTQTKTELRRKEQVVKQLDEHIQQMELQKKELENSVYDAERALRAVARDKDSLTNYIQTVQGAFERAKSDQALSRSASGGREFSLSKLLLSNELLPNSSGQVGPEIVAFRNLVGSFVDTHQQTLVKIDSLQEEVESHRRHVAMLKNELNAACRREYEEEVPSFSSRFRPTPDVLSEKSGRQDFAPLVEDTDTTISPVKPISDSKRLNTVRKSASDQRLGKSTEYHTPSLSRRHPSGRINKSDGYR